MKKMRSVWLVMTTVGLWLFACGPSDESEGERPVGPFPDEATGTGASAGASTGGSPAGAGGGAGGAAGADSDPVTYREGVALVCSTRCRPDCSSPLGLGCEADCLEMLMRPSLECKEATFEYIRCLYFDADAPVFFCPEHGPGAPCYAEYLPLETCSGA